MLRTLSDKFMDVNKIPMLTDYPLPLDNTVIPSTPFAMALIGSMGSGKTNLLCKKSIIKATPVTVCDKSV